MHRNAAHWCILLVACFGLVFRPRNALTCTQFATAPVDVPAIIGERVYLYCDYPGSISETWSTDNGITIQSSPSNGYQCNCFPQTNGTGSVLYFPQVGSGDYRNYTCSVQIGFGINCHVTAAIRAAVPPVLLAVGSTNRTANQGSPVTFSVSLTNPGTPLASVVWSKNGVPLSNTSNMVVTSTMLQLSNLTALSRGQYIATATSKAGSSTINFDLFVNYLAVMPIVSNTVGSSGSQIQLTCLAEGYPRISSIVWRRSSLQVQQFTMVNAYTWTASTSLVVGVDCTQTYQCVAMSTEQSLPSPVQNSSACPSSVSSLSTKPVGSNAVLLLWQPIQAVSSYAIMYKVSGSSQYLEGPRVTCNTACNATVTGLTLGFLYIFTLTYSNTQMVTATAIITPGLTPVTGLSAIFAGDSSLNQITLTWNEVPKASGYFIYINDATFSDTQTPAATATIILGCGRRYTLQVQAYNDTSLSTLSAPVLMPLDFCSSLPGIASVSTKGGVLRVQLTNVPSDAAIGITAVQDSGQLHSYELLRGLTEACVDDLPFHVMHTICATFRAGGGSSSQDCYPNKVSLESTGVGALCNAVLVSKSIVDSKVETLEAPIASQPWVIGLALVGTLGVLATLSCAAVFLYVKRTGKEAEVGSDSLPTAVSSAFIAAKSEDQKSYKCLCMLCMNSSHNILWDQHRDTLEHLGSTGALV